MRIKSPLIKQIVATENLNVNDILQMKGKVFSYVNPVSYLDALDNKNLFSSMDGLFVDGSLMAAAVHFCYGTHITRRSPDMVGFLPQLFDYAESHHKSICIVGSTQEQKEKAVSKFSANYENIEWVLCRDGFFSDETEMVEYAKSISREQPDFLICGLGCILQERFLLLCKNAGYNGVGFSCGGFIRQIAENSKEKYYPNWINRMNLRFLYRMYKEPHTRKRYLKAGFVFPVRFIWERFFG